MPSVTLGTTPPRLTVWLVADAPLTATVTANEAWPAPPELIFDTGTTWASTLSTDNLTAAWALSAAQVGALADTGPRRATLRDPGSHTVYAHGTVYTSRVVESGEPSLVVGGASTLTVDATTIPSITYVVGDGGGGGGTTDHAALTNRDAPDQHPIGAVTGLQAVLDGKQAAGSYAPTVHTHDDRYFTEAEVTAALAGKANTADLGGAALLDVGTAAGTVAAGNHNHTGVYAPALGADDNYVTDAQLAALHTHPAVVAQGATQADARAAIGAGTSNLAIGTTAGTAKAGDYAPDLSGLLTTAAAPELIRDTMGIALVAGANVTITPNDPGDTITIAASGGGGGAGLSGTGSPEGVVTAAVGAEYVDTAATFGAIKWLKFAGTGSTGWRCIAGGTGWRIVSSAGLVEPTDVADTSFWMHLAVIATASGQAKVILRGDVGTATVPGGGTWKSFAKSKTTVAGWGINVDGAGRQGAAYGISSPFPWTGFWDNWSFAPYAPQPSYWPSRAELRGEWDWLQGAGGGAWSPNPWPISLPGTPA